MKTKQASIIWTWRNPVMKLLSLLFPYRPLKAYQIGLGIHIKQTTGGEP